MESFLDIVGISKQFDVVQALKDVSFSIRKGEVHALLGENGAGKSTLIKIISGEECPSSGQIVMEGEPMRSYHPRAAMAMGIAMVHQELAVFDNVTVAENIFPELRPLYPARLHRPEGDEPGRARDVSICSAWTSSPRRRMDSLTLAQQQMVEILRSISTGKKVILLTSPTSASTPRDRPADEDHRPPQGAGHDHHLHLPPHQ